jgi:hypothetical protein
MPLNRSLPARIEIPQNSRKPKLWRQDDPEASALPVALQRATLKRLDEAA